MFRAFTPSMSSSCGCEKSRQSSRALPFPTQPLVFLAALPGFLPRLFRLLLVGLQRAFLPVDLDQWLRLGGVSHQHERCARGHRTVLEEHLQPESHPDLHTLGWDESKSGLPDVHQLEAVAAFQLHSLKLRIEEECGGELRAHAHLRHVTGGFRSELDTSNSRSRRCDRARLSSSSSREEHDCQEDGWKREEHRAWTHGDGPTRSARPPSPGRLRKRGLSQRHHRAFVPLRAPPRNQ